MVPTTQSELSWQMNVFKLHRWSLTITETTSVELEESLLIKYLKAYVAALPIGQFSLFYSSGTHKYHQGKSLPKTEIQPADDLAILAASALISLHLLTSKRSYLSSAVTVLEYALARSPQGFQHRLLIIRLYRLLGAPSLALEHYRKLGIKQVQHDSMFHFVQTRCSAFSLAAMGDLTYLQECTEASNIYIANTSEVGASEIRLV